MDLRGLTMSKINAGQASSTLISEYIGSDFDSVLKVADNIEAVKLVAKNSNNYIHPTGDGNLHVPATGTNNKGYVLKAGATAGVISWGQLTAADVGAGSEVSVREAFRRSYADAGLTLIDGSFETGGTLNSATDVLLLNATAKAYAWTGAYPKVVAPGTDPTVVAGYVPRKDVVLRSDLASVGGVALVGNASARCNVVSELKSAAWISIGKTVETTGYHNIFDGGGCTYQIVSSVGVTFDEANYIALSNPALAAKAIWPDVPTAAQFGCKFDGSDSTRAMQKAVDHGGVITVGDGDIGITSIDLRGKSVYLKCAGPQLTKFNGLAASVMFNAFESVDVTHSPFGISGCAIDGKGVATAGIKNRFRHKTEIDNLIITGCVDGLYEVDSWNNLRNNITIHGNTNGLVCDGANNNCNYRGLSIYGNSGYQLKILDNGEAPGGSTALSFTNCDIEFAAGDGIYMDTASTIPFFSCYIGEQIQGKVFDIARGKAVMYSGLAYWGTNATSYLAYCAGGDLHMERVTLNGDASVSLSNIAFSGNGRLTLDSCDGAITITDAQVMTGDTIGYGKQFECFAPKLGRKYTGFCLNGTFTERVIGNGKKVTAATSTGSPTLLELHANVNPDWISGGQGYLVVTYKSSKPCSVRLTSGPVGNTPSIDIVGTLPATTAVKTAVLLNWTYTDGVYPTIFEIFQNSSVVGDTLELIDVYLSDSRMSYSGAGSTIKSLSKC